MPEDDKLKNTAKLIDHTLLRPDAVPEQIMRICAEARRYGFAVVCVNPVWVRLASGLMTESEVKICTVIGFPLGAGTTAVKVYEAQNAMDGGAVELDMVLNIGALKARERDLVGKDIRAVVQTAHGRKVLVKVILENCFLSEEEKIIACTLCREAGADFVKTSTGFASGGATVEDVQLMRRIVGPEMGVKAAGGIRTLAGLEKMIHAGANRIGTSSGVAIMEELQRAVHLQLLRRFQSEPGVKEVR